MLNRLERSPSRRSALQLLCGLASTALIPRFASQGSAQQVQQQVQTNRHGMSEYRAPNMTLVTDLPLDDELKAWPTYLAQALPQWLAFFAAPASRLETFKPTVYLVGDKTRWKELGLLDAIPPLEDGYQNVDDLYIAEQPSVYYRRLLFLHEATHAIMLRCHGSGGGAWIWEGTADYLGTHRITNGRLELGYYPPAPEEVPYWGRIRLIRESIRQGNAPKLSEILGFPDMRTDRMLRYSWSWAACTFLLSHPETGDEFRALYPGGFEQPSEQLFEHLARRWHGLSIGWRAFIDDLDFGTDLANSSLLLNDKLRQPSIPDSPIPIAADRGWQIATGPIEPGTKLKLTASGRVVVRQQGTDPAVSRSAPAGNYPWESEPPGLTIEYVRGHPLGGLVGAWGKVDREETSTPWERFRIGNGLEIEAPSERSVLLLRVNDRASQLKENSGSYRVAIMGPRKTEQ